MTYWQIARLIGTLALLGLLVLVAGRLIESTKGAVPL